MTNSYFTLPLKSGDLITNKTHTKCNLKQSIAQHINLINTSYFGECVFDESYGCNIWDIDFDNLSSSNKIKETVTKSLTTSLTTHEKRLSKISVAVFIKQEEITATKKGLVIKKKVTINISGKVKKTNEAFNYTEYFYIGPLSY